MPKKQIKKTDDVVRPNAPIHEEEEKEIDPDLILDTAGAPAEEEESEPETIGTLLTEFDEEDLNPFGDKWEE